MTKFMMMMNDKSNRSGRQKEKKQTKFPFKKWQKVLDGRLSDDANRIHLQKSRIKKIVAQ